MKKLTLFFSLMLVVSLLAISTPAMAGPMAPVGDRISMYGWPTEFAAGAPFNIRHGWVQSSTDEGIGVFDFRLDVDGVPQPLSYRWFYSESGNPDSLYRIFVYNFPDGLPAGSHTFTGHWIAPCQYAVDFLEYTGTCTTPNAPVETYSRTHTVTFLP